MVRVWDEAEASRAQAFKTELQGMLEAIQHSRNAFDRDIFNIREKAIIEALLYLFERLEGQDE